MQYIVTKLVQSPGNEPVTITWYIGDDLPQALSAMVSASVDSSEFKPALGFRTLSVTLDIHDHRLAS